MVRMVVKEGLLPGPVVILETKMKGATLTGLPPLPVMVMEEHLMAKMVMGPSPETTTALMSLRMPIKAVPVPSPTIPSLIGMIPSTPNPRVGVGSWKRRWLTS
jgi:hypothetical protein